MVEILYRGKTFKDKWIEGLPWKKKYNDGNRVFISYFPDMDDNEEREPVKKETLGRFSGITDKHGIKVFVGDILKDSDGKLYLVVEEETRIVIKKQDKRVTTWKYTHKKEIVGNIHDNPDLWRWNNGKNI